MSFDPVSLGMLLLLIGLVFFLLVWSLPRLFRGLRSNPAPAVPLQTPTDAFEHDHAVMLVQSGGRVDYLNATARKWLDLLAEEDPNLEVIARRILPAEEFLKLCAAEGQMRLSVNGRPMEVVSYQVPGPTPAWLVSMRRPDIASSESGQSNELSGSALKS